MPRFAANLSLLYPELPLIERVAAAARDGFAAVEVQAPYAAPVEDWRHALRDAGIPLVLLNAPMTCRQDDGGMGFAARPGSFSEFKDAMDHALHYAQALDCPQVHVLAGVCDRDVPPQQAARAYLASLAYACDLLRPTGRTVNIEPINRHDVPGYFLHTQQQAADVIAALGRDNLGLQMDLYHVQRSEGDLARRIERHFPLISHVQIAGVPGRHEPDVGEVRYPWLLQLLDRLGYRGTVGCEYRPLRGACPGGTSAGLGWMRASV